VTGEITEKSKRIINEVRRIISYEARIPFAFLFGSCAEGRDTVLSDIDLALYFADMEEDEKTNIEHRLWMTSEEKVNILRLEDDDISPAIRLKAVEGIPILVRDQDSLNQFILSIVHRAKETELVLGRLRRI
jgi:predicted nucleotidyltransferase